MSDRDSHRSLEQMLRLGRFGDALAYLRADSSGYQRSIERSLLLAEVNVLAGHASDAHKIAARLVDHPSTTVEQRLRAQTVLAQVLIDNGNAHAAEEILKRVVQGSREAKAWRCRCWAELWLLTAIGEFSSAGDIRSFLKGLRQHVNQLGDPTTSIALHLFVAEAESRRGVIDSSIRHVKIARSLLARHPNYWLEGLASIDALCLSYMRSDAAAARDEAESALRSAFEAGAEKTRLAAISNAGTIALGSGDLAVAEKKFREALKLSKVAPRWRSSILDGLCQLEMARGNLRGARECLQQLTSGEIEVFSYQALWLRLSSARLELLSGDPISADALAQEALKDAIRMDDRELIVRLRLLLAEIATRTGQLQRASQELQRATVGHADPSLEILAELNRVKGLLLSASGEADAAEVIIARTKRVFLAIGHQRAAAELPVERHPCSVSKSFSEKGHVTLSRAAAIFELSPRADLVGSELLDLLKVVGCVRGAALLVIGGDESVAVKATLGWSNSEARAALDGDDQFSRLDVGSWLDQRWLIVAEVLPNAAAWSAFIAVRTLLTASRVAETARREIRERAALWPMDPVDDATHGVFVSEAMLELVKTIRRVAQTPVTILLTGETGTGKDILARLIHEYSPRASKMFVPFNCTAVPREMLDSQLFGHRRGAFTGAQEQSPGVIRGAQGGTLFLDEIGELGVEAQVKLLRFLESTEVHPIGESHPVQVDVRVVAATNRDLDALVRDGLFRDDLFYRLNVIRLRVPPLRERREEIPAIVDHYLTRLGHEFKKGPLTASSEAMEYLLLHPWPGNVRQLANELRRAAALADADAVIMPEHLSPQITASRRTVPASERDLLPTEVVVRIDQPLGPATEHLERTMIQHAMTLAHGHMDQAAQLLGISRKGLYLKRQRLGLEPPTPAAGALGEHRSHPHDDSLPS
jgi:DNA-binding NtrC family response regulator/tetratricopeptide (TPR) repeat protein